MTNTEQYLARIRAAARDRRTGLADVDHSTVRLHHWINEASSEGRISQRLIGEAAGVTQQRIAQIVSTKERERT